MLTLTVVRPVVKIRRGPSTAGGIIKDAKIGETYDVIQLLDDPDRKSPEQWAKIVLPEQQNINAYICVRLPSGSYLCNVENVPDKPKGDDYNRGFMDGRREMVNRMIDFLKSEQ
jgi:hypothetical protein